MSTFDYQSRWAGHVVRGVIFLGIIATALAGYFCYACYLAVSADESSDLILKVGIGAGLSVYLLYAYVQWVRLNRSIIPNFVIVVLYCLYFQGIEQRDDDILLAILLVGVSYSAFLFAISNVNVKILFLTTFGTRETPVQSQDIYECSHCKADVFEGDLVCKKCGNDVTETKSA